ncbi:hypothetical protein [Saccharomonospora azurea]|uniref:Uncharacterized protein n=1 Tax=Saccharomonospora azurea NA-128 TaxID=882081 RepID=H8G7T2_9PSEU|nr:hypothetical protein [Saccharomonospora azurea]EHY87356.1 hypothetical protein SacazDRAFT_00382 [Saccharomonospora azurea NA-128]
MSPPVTRTCACAAPHRAARGADATYRTLVHRLARHELTDLALDTEWPSTEGES